MNELAKKDMKFCQADELIKALHIMNNTELKFMFYALSKRKLGDTAVQTTMADLFKCLKLDWGGEQIKTYKKVIESIIKKSVLTVEMPADRLSEADRIRLKKSTDTVLVSGALMSAKVFNGVNDMVIELSFNKDFIPMLDDLKHDFTWIYLEQMARLNGKYSARLYEWCKMQLKAKEQCEFIWYLNTDSKEAPGIRQWLNVGDKYPDYRDFNKRILKPSFDEINKCTSDIQVSFTPLRSGKRLPIYALHMNVSTKNGVSVEEVANYKAQKKAEEEAKEAKKTKNNKKESLYERIQRVPFQNEKQKELFEYIVNRYDYDIHAIKAESTDARIIRKLMQWSFGIEDYTENPELRVVLLDYFEHMLSKNPKFKNYVYSLDELSRLANDDDDDWDKNDQLKIDIVKQSLASGYYGLFPLRNKSLGTMAERLAALPF